MNESLNIFNALRRPNLMIRAAKIGVETYRRERDLKRLLGHSKVANVQYGFETLLTMEQDLEATRCAGDATYSITRHVEILTALIAEASLFRRAPRQAI